MNRSDQLQPAKPDSLNLDDVAQMLHENNQKLAGLILQARLVHESWRGIMFGEGSQLPAGEKPIEGRPPLAVMIRAQQGMIEELEKTLYILRENFSNPTPQVEPIRQTAGHAIAALR